MAEPKKLLEWRSRQSRGAIMKPATFAKIEKGAEKRYHIGKGRAAKIAGSAYWMAAESKFKHRKGRHS